MPKTKKTTKYLVPTLFVAVLVCALVMGVLYIRNYLMEQTIQERSYQLEEMVSQIQVNLNYGLETHWNLVTAIETAAEGKYLGDEQELCIAIAETEKVHQTESYGCRVMLIDEIGTAYTTEGDMGIWDDINHLSDGEEHHTFISDTSNVDGTFLAFAHKLDDPITVGADEKRFTHIVLLKEIETLKKYYTTETYGGNAATYIIKKNGTMAYYDANDDDIFGVRNIFKALEEAEYIQETDFNAIRDRLAAEGIATANIMLDGTEYYYCLTTIETYDMTLMLLISAEYVAVSTMNMMNSTVQMMFIFMTAMVVILVLAIINFIKVERSNQRVKIEQKNNQELNELRIAAEDALNIAEAASKSKSIFLSNMSHDIRTPMNAVIGFTTLAMANVENTERVKDYLSKILSSSNHLLSLINDILDMSRIESGKIKLDETEANLSDMLHDIKTIINGQIHAKQLELFMDVIDVTDEDVICDKTRINQVVHILLESTLGRYYRITRRTLKTSAPSPE